MVKTVKDRLAGANAPVEKIDYARATSLIADGALVVDIRDAPEVAVTGKVAGAVHVPRGILGFRANSATPQLQPRIQNRPSGDPVLRQRWTGGPVRQIVARDGLYPCLQHGRVQGLGRGWRCGRADCR